MATTASGERYKSRGDLSAVVCDAGTIAAGVFTQSSTAGAPVLWSREVLSNGAGRAMVVNAGNANVFTGCQGKNDVRSMAAKLAEKVTGLEKEQVFVSSTGVIGEYLDMACLEQAIAQDLHLSEQQDWLALANAIGTTDTYPKVARAIIELGGEVIHFAGLAKGSGMIEPNMATMLAYVFTDAKLSQALLQTCLLDVTQRSFNAITVDSDTSTSDTCLLFATCLSGPMIEAVGSDYAAFAAALEEVMRDLAQQIVRDGEGASKFITVHVCGAKNDESAQAVAKSIANSPLVKTAIAGGDANWGRIVMAVGKTNEPVVLHKLTISMGSVLIATGDGLVDGYDESLVAQHLAGQDITIDVDLGGAGAGEATVWTCDLTHGYIDINADYRS